MNLSVLKNEKEKIDLQKKAYNKLKEIGHRVGSMDFNPDADYLSEFKYPFNQSHGLNIQDII